MKNIKNIGILFIFLIVGTGVWAQDNFHYTQYMYNSVLFNPAYTGSRNVLSINGLHRSQWVGLDGAPRTQALSVNTPMGEKLAVGASITRSESGVQATTSFAADVSYTLPLNDDGVRFSFGVKGGIQSLNVDFKRLTIEDPEASLQREIQKTSPIFGIGGYLYAEKWYVGLSSPNILSTRFYKERAGSIVSLASVYATAGYVFQLKERVKFKPATMIRLTEGLPLAVDVSANFLLHERLTLGAAYRLDAAISGLVGFQFSKEFMFGYAYDYDTTALSDYNSGSHEFFFRYEFFVDVKKKVNPRFF